MHGHTRREFLKRSAAAGGALALTPLGGLAAQETTGSSAEMAIARWKGKADEMKVEAQKMTKQAIDAIGGMKRFVKKGDVVWVKPNMAWNNGPEFAANTNPDVVATLIRLCFDAGAKTVKVGDRTVHEAKKSYAASGIEAAAKEAGGEIVYLDDNRFKEVEIKGKILDKWEVYPEILNADLVINAAIVKHHSLAKVTMCMKNYMGVVGGDRGKWHQDISTCLCDITAFMKPQLCVLDAIRVLKDHGPSGGSLDDVKRLDTLAVGTDIVALDALGAELMGHKPDDIPLIPAAAAAGLGTADYRTLKLRELEVT